MVNPNAYLGDSTRTEIAHAQSTNKPITYTHPTSPPEPAAQPPE
ncbi:hypothetical protein GCM10009534_25430 [Kribbella sandramycini]